MKFVFGADSLTVFCRDHETHIISYNLNSTLDSCHYENYTPNLEILLDDDDDEHKSNF